jgi:uncharacterized protein DUF4180
MRVYEYDGPVLGTEQDAVNLIGDALSIGAEVVAVHADLLDPDFFDLSSGLAGAVMQKFVNYRLTLAVLGDISAYLEASHALHDLVYESNNGSQVWFLPDHHALDARITA